MGNNNQFQHFTCHLKCISTNRRPLVNKGFPQWAQTILVLNSRYLSVVWPRQMYSCTTPIVAPFTFTGLGDTCRLCIIFPFSIFIPSSTRFEELFSISSSWDAAKMIHYVVCKSQMSFKANSFGEITSSGFTPRWNEISLVLFSCTWTITVAAS